MRSRFLKDESFQQSRGVLNPLRLPRTCSREGGLAGFHVACTRDAAARAQYAPQRRFSRSHATTRSGDKFMTVPSVRPIVAITHKTAVNDPHRMKKSKAAGPLPELTPGRYQSGETAMIGGLSRIGDAMVRAMLYEVANALSSRTTRFSALKRWGLAVGKRLGTKRAKFAVARKIAVILHRMCINGTFFAGATRRPLRILDLGRGSFMTSRLSLGTRIRCQSLAPSAPLGWGSRCPE
jgi:hypothetical protein